MLVPDAKRRELLNQRLRRYQEQFWDSVGAQEYWLNRGFSLNTARDFQIGFVADPLVGDGGFRGCLAIPYITASQRVVSFKFRSINQSVRQRFMKDPGDPARIFNTRALVNARSVVITEGELDAVAASQCGLTAVAIPGATMWKPEWGRIFRNRVVTVFADGDEAGAQFAERLSSALYGIRVVQMPDGEDVNSMLMQRGQEWIREAAFGR